MASTPRLRPQVPSAALDAQHEERIVERVAGRARASEHRDAQDTLHGPARCADP